MIKARRVLCLNRDWHLQIYETQTSIFKIHSTSISIHHYLHTDTLTIDLDIQNAMFNLLIAIYNFFVFPFGVLTFGNVKTTW